MMTTGVMSASGERPLVPNARSRGRLLFVVNQTGFFLSHRASLAEAASQAGYEVYVAVPRGDRIEELHARGFRTQEYFFDRNGTNPLNELRSLWELVRMMRRLRPDLVHALTVQPVLYAGIAARLTRMPAIAFLMTGTGYIWSSRSFKAKVLRAMVSQVYRFVFAHPNARAIFQNSENRQAFIDGRLVPSAKTALIRGSGVDANIFRPPEKPSDLPQIVMASRMLWSKGVKVFCDAAKACHEDGVTARFVVVGAPDEGNPECVPREWLEARDREGFVSWLGHCDDMPGLLAQTTVLCLPTTYGEGLPKVLLEGAACGLPLIATDIPGCREVVRHEWNGLLIPGNDVSALSQAIKRLLRSDAEREAMGRNGRQMVLEDFVLGRINQQFLDVYAELSRLEHA